MMHVGFQTTLNIIPASKLEAKPWAAGTTTEMVRLPADSSFERRDFVCRVSTATVGQDMPFTKFDGYQRVLALVSGAGVELTIDGKVHRLDKRFQQVRFPGDVPTQAKLLDGPIADFNVIFRPEVDVVVRTIAVGTTYQTVSAPGAEGGGQAGFWRRDILWNPYGTFEVECGRERVTVQARDVFVLDHDKRAVSLSVRALREPSEILMTSLGLPSPMAR